MKKPRKNTSGGKSPPRGVSLQSSAAAWFAVHALGKTIVGRMFGVDESAYPLVIQHETSNAVDDIRVVLSSDGQIFIQATRQPQPAKVNDFLRQATSTWLSRKHATGANFLAPLKRGRDALVLLVPGDAPRTLDNLEKVCRKFESFEHWDDVPFSSFNEKESKALTQARSVIGSHYKSLIGHEPSEDELVELLGLIRTVRVNLDRGESDERVASTLLQGLGLKGHDVFRAWDRLCRENIDWMQNASGGSREGIRLCLQKIGINLDDEGTLSVGRVATNIVTPGSSNDLAKALLSEAEEKLPPTYAEEELSRLLKRSRQRMNFADPDINYPREIRDLAQRAIRGDLSKATTETRWKVVSYAARSAASTKEQIQEAEGLLREAEKIAPGKPDPITRAAILSYENMDGAQRTLRDLKTPEACSQLFALITKQRSPEEAVKWVRDQGWTITDLNSVGANNIALQAIFANDLDFARLWIAGVSPEQLEQTPALQAIRADLTFASSLPSDEQQSVILSLPFDLRMVRVAEDKASRSAQLSAITDLEATLATLEKLGLVSAAKRIKEKLVWLQGLDPEKRDAAKKSIAQGMKEDPAIWTRLALRFDVPFDRDSLRRDFDKLSTSGGWNADEGNAYLLLEMETSDPGRVATFITENREKLLSSNFVSPLGLASFEIQTLAKSGNFAGARKRLEEAIPASQPELRASLETIIQEAEGSVDALAAARIRYDQNKSTEDLRHLCQTLNDAGLKEALAEPSMELVRQTRNVNDLKPSLNLLANLGRFADALKLLNEVPTLGVGDPVIEKYRAESLLRTGDFAGAREILKTHFSEDIDAHVIQTWMQVEVESGQWSNLQGLLDRARASKERFSGIELIRLAHLAREVDSGHVNEFMEAALSKADNNASVYMGAYTLTVEKGKEAKDERTAEWFSKAVELSDDTGPVQKKSLQEIADMAPGWRQHEERINKMVREGEVPLFLAARSLNIALTNAVLGRALANSASKDASTRSPILAFDGSRNAASVLQNIQVLAVDVSSLLTLGYLGLTETLVSSFSKIVIGFGTLSSLFEERQRVRFHQPSRIERAKRLLKMFADGKLRVAEPPPSTPESLKEEVGQELAGLLTLARSNGGQVVRPWPVHKVGTQMEVNAQLEDEYQQLMTDTRQVIDSLIADGLLDSEIGESARTYVQNADAGMPKPNPLASGKPLYIDDVALSYLEYTHSLEALCDRGVEVSVAPSVLEEAKALVAYESHTEKILEAIESVRAALEKGISSGTVIVADEVRADVEAEQDLRRSPTLALMLSSTPFEALLIDDKFVNRHTTWTSKVGQSTVATTLDLLQELEDRASIPGKRAEQMRRKLREGGYQSIPITADELLKLVNATGVKDGRLVETKEMRALRESVLLTAARKTLLPREEFWILGSYAAALQASRTLWSSDATDCEEKCEWILDALPDIDAFVPVPVAPEVWSKCRQVRAAQIAFFFNTLTIPPEKRPRYSKWVESKIIAPLKERDPELFAEAVERYKQLLKGFADGLED